MTEHVEGAHGAQDADGAGHVAPSDAPQVAPGEYLTREQLQAVNDELTVGDGFRANVEAKGDHQKAGMLIYLYAARRLGMVARGTELEAFLDQIKQADFQAVLGIEARESKSTGSTE